MKISELHFYEEKKDCETKWFAYFAGYRITVVDRLTGYGDGIRDVETGLKDYSIKGDDNFWLASGRFNIRDFPDLDIYDAIDKIKENANTVIPKEIR
jgi:hypothetical protein